MSFILSGSKRPLSARAVECFAAGQREPPLAVLANEAAPLRPGQVRAACVCVYTCSAICMQLQMVYRMHMEAPLCPWQVVRIGVGRRGACFRNVDETARVVFNLG